MAGQLQRIQRPARKRSSSQDAVTPADVVSVARCAIGAPFRFGGKSVTHGIDCVGLIEWVCGELSLPMPKHVGYSNLSRGRFIVETARESLGEECDPSTLGSVLVLKYGRRRFIPKHFAIKSEGREMIHADNSDGVIERPIPHGSVECAFRLLGVTYE